MRRCHGLFPDCCRRRAEPIFSCDAPDAPLNEPLRRKWSVRWNARPINFRVGLSRLFCNLLRSLPRLLLSLPRLLCRLLRCLFCDFRFLDVLSHLVRLSIVARYGGPRRMRVKGLLVPILGIARRLACEFAHDADYVHATIAPRRQLFFESGLPASSE
jgi:hypothetical protein